MSERVTHRLAIFRHPFTLDGVDGPLPPGTYSIETIEEPIENLSFLAYRRVSTTITLAAADTGTLSRQVVSIDPHQLEAAEKLDAARAAED